MADSIEDEVSDKLGALKSAFSLDLEDDDEEEEEDLGEEIVTGKS
jgi:hypothetical protein